MPSTCARRRSARVAATGARCSLRRLTREPPRPVRSASGSGAPATVTAAAAAARRRQRAVLEELRAIHAEIDARKYHMDSLTASLYSLKRVKARQARLAAPCDRWRAGGTIVPLAAGYPYIREDHPLSFRREQTCGYFRATGWAQHFS